MNAPQSPQLALNRRQVRSILFGLIAAMLLAALDQTIVATALPTIGRDLGDVENLPWIVTSYLLASTAVTPLYGKLSDIHGRRIVMLIAITVFSLGSILCAIAPTMVVLAIARALQGIGGGGLIALSQTILADIVPPKRRAGYQVYIASVFTTSSLAGPLLGGFFAQHLHWSIIFWINLPIGLLAYLLTNGNLKLLPRHERRHRLDYLGSALLVLGSSSLLLALSWGGIRFPWASTPILSLLFIAGVSIVAFATRLQTAPEPLIPLSVLKNPVIYRATLSACFGMGTLIGLTIYVPIFLEGVVGLDPSRSGLAMVPMMLGTVAGATLSSRSMIYFCHYKRIPLLMLAVSFVSSIGVALHGNSLPFWFLEVLFTLLSMGIGTILPLSTIVIQNAVAQHQLGIATAAMNFFRSLGGALIVAAFGAIVLKSGGVGPEGGHELQGLIGGSDTISLTDAFRWVFAASCVGILLTFGCVAILEERPLHS